MITLGADGNVAAILSDFGGDPQRAEGLAAFLGFELVSNPEDRLAGALSGGLKHLLCGCGDGGFGVSELYRVGSCKAAPAEAGAGDLPACRSCSGARRCYIAGGKTSGTDQRDQFSIDYSQ